MASTPIRPAERPPPPSVPDLLVAPELAALSILDVALEIVVAALLADGEARRAQGAAGREAVASNRGSLARLLALIEERINAGSTTV